MPAAAVGWCEAYFDEERVLPEKAGKIGDLFALNKRVVHLTFGEDTGPSGMGNPAKMAGFARLMLAIFKPESGERITAQAMKLLPTAWTTGR
jgi:hypothetical protein